MIFSENIKDRPGETRATHKERSRIVSLSNVSRETFAERIFALPKRVRMGFGLAWRRTLQRPAHGGMISRPDFRERSIDGINREDSARTFGGQRRGLDSLGRSGAYEP